MDEQTLAKFCSQKDRMAEEELYRRYAARVNALCRRYLADTDEANDLTLEVLVRALRNISTFKYTGKGSLAAWISRIAINMSINHLRRRRLQMVPLDFLAKDTIPEPADEDMATVPEKLLESWISGLTDLRRTVFNLYSLDGYSHQEIGRMLGISERASISALAKARKQLKEKIRQYLKNQEL